MHSVIAQTDHVSYSNPRLLQYFNGGYAKDGKLFLSANEQYVQLELAEKRALLSTLLEQLANHDVEVLLPHKQRELWLAHSQTPMLTAQWTADSLSLEDFMPRQIKRTGRDRWFYYVGGAYNMSTGMSDDNSAFLVDAMLNLRGGTYLYRDLIDVALSLSFGYNANLDDDNDDGTMTTSIGISTRYYIKPKPQMSVVPYVGIGASYTISDEDYFEPQLLGGVCWFVGPGSLDAGLQWGKTSKWGLTVGYTFRPGTKKK